MSAADARHLRWPEERISDGLVAGVVLTTDDRARHLGGRLWALPVAALWGSAEASWRPDFLWDLAGC